MPAAPHNNNATAQRSCRNHGNVEKINQEIKQIRKVPSINVYTCQCVRQCSSILKQVQMHNLQECMFVISAMDLTGIYRSCTFNGFLKNISKWMFG